MNNRGRTPGSSGRTVRPSVQQNGLTMRKRDMTPTRNTNLVPNASFIGDRFLGVRLDQDELDHANHLMTSKLYNKENLNNSISEPNSPEKKNVESEALKQMMRHKSAGALTDADDGDRILCYKKNLAPPPAIGYINQAKVLYSTNSVINPASSVKKSTRHVKESASKVLDGPGLTKDLYSRHLDWGCHNWVAVALGHELYLWNTETCVIKNFFEDNAPTSEGMITSVRWSQEGRYISLGYASGAVKVIFILLFIYTLFALKIYDPNRPKTTEYVRELRTLRVGGASRCASIAWKKQGVMTCGYKSGDIVNHDVRVAQHVVSSWGGDNGHSRDITALEWSSDENMCVSASSDRTAKVWDGRHTRGDGVVQDPEPLFTIDEHTGQVRTAQFCSFRDGILATAGGINDGTVRLWDVKRQCQKIRELNVCETGGVGGIVFNRPYSEMLTASDDGFLRIFRFNANYKLSHEIQTSNEPIMDLVGSPYDEVLIGDMEETLKVFQLFTVDKSTNILDRTAPKNVGLNVR
ncbi:Protein CBR-FZY-1 [Caenorhabditis briggsae]|uniref:Protein CBR-FZY-1 n=1 Tax=Caenorhabditis briggsae TaxID=6238 RepID=A8WUD1_CAEBR|nr:Protein CBR-FZY-1 [Caenorhabditis briggsae]CAP24093.2 Protein CBR-FZY-1 [Caenorhabditis briggsae]